MTINDFKAEDKEQKSFKKEGLKVNQNIIIMLFISKEW
jgi:hypothetical protein